MPVEHEKSIKEFKDLLKRLEELNLPQDQFAVFGSGPMAIRGIRKAEDLDIVVTDDLWQELARKYPLRDFGWGYKAQMANRVEAVSKPGFGLDAKDLIQNADLIDGLRFVRLADILKWKEALGRERDLTDIKLIKEYLKNHPPIK